MRLILINFIIVLAVLNLNGQIGNITHVNKVAGVDLTDENRVDLQILFDEDKRLVDSCDNVQCKIFRYHRIASIYYVLKSDLDSTAHFLNKALNLDKDLTCRVLQKNYEKSQKKDIPRWMSNNYFASTFSSIWWQNAQESCAMITKDTLLNTESIKTSKYDKILKMIEIRDQKDRAALRYSYSQRAEEQKNRDLQNRNVLDSLYNSDGKTLLELSNKSDQTILWLVLQHSTDCEWNKKWFQIFLDAYGSGDYNGGFLDQSFQRFYHPETGYCTLKNNECSRAFIELLKKKYPAEYGKRFGYNSF